MNSSDGPVVSTAYCHAWGLEFESRNSQYLFFFWNQEFRKIHCLSFWIQFNFFEFNFFFKQIQFLKMSWLPYWFFRRDAHASTRKRISNWIELELFSYWRNVTKRWGAGAIGFLTWNGNVSLKTKDLHQSMTSTSIISNGIFCSCKWRQSILQTRCSSTWSNVSVEWITAGKCQRKQQTKLESICLSNSFVFWKQQIEFRGGIFVLKNYDLSPCGHLFFFTFFFIVEKWNLKWFD